jgi:hypothetical protein
MKLFEPLILKFEDANWSRNPVFGLIDAILELHPELIGICAGRFRDMRKVCKDRP